MKRLIVSGKIGYLFLALAIGSPVGFLFMASAEAYDSSGVNLAIYTDQEHADMQFMLGVEPVALLIVIKNEAGVPIVTARGFSQVELYKSLIVTDPKGMRHVLAPGDDAHKMPFPYFLNSQTWDLAEMLPQAWARSVTIDDLREKVPSMNSTAGWYTIEAQQPFVRFAATGDQEGLGLIGLVDNANNWSGTIKSNSLQIYLAPMAGAQIGVKVVDGTVEPQEPLAQVPVKIVKKADIPAGYSLDAIWDQVEPSLLGVTDFNGSTTWKAESACLVDDNYTVIAKYGGAYQSTEIVKTLESRWDAGCTGSIQKTIVFGTLAPREIQITGAGFNFPETPKYRAVFSVSAISKDSKLSGKVTYNYTRTRMLFSSTKIGEVTVIGATAIIKGEGTVNQAKGYTFEAIAVDGAPDQFGITIRKPTGAIHYQAATKALSGGELRISVK